MCKHCKREVEGKHIGKSSFGWCFGVHIYHEDGIKNLSDWEKLFSKKGSYIKDECGERISSKEMKSIIRERKMRNSRTGKYYWKQLYESENEFLEANHAIKGPNGLLRRKIGTNCEGHGIGTWDYCVGEFS